MEAGHDYNAALNKAKKDLEKMKKEEVDLTPEEIEMIEAKMAGVADGALPGDQHMCATKVFHKEWNEGVPVPTMHADPDEDGLIEWYDVMFDHGIERVMTEDMEILDEKMHGHKKMKEEAEQVDESMASAIKRAEASRQRVIKRAARQAKRMGGSDNAIKNAMRDHDVFPRDEKHVRKHMGEQAEQIDEISAKTIDRYREQSHRKEYPGPKGSKKYEKRAKGSIMAFNKLTGRAKVPATESFEMTEARGRPKKAEQMDYTVHPKTKEKLMHNNPTHMKRIENLYRIGTLKRPKTEAGQNIITQLRKASTSMRGGETINFTHGTAKHVSAAHAQKLLDKHAGMKPAEKESFQNKIGHSHEQMKKHV